METLASLVEFLKKLEDRNIYYELNKIRDSILIEVSFTGQRWEVEFMEDGSIEIEKFISDGSLFDEQEIDVLFNEWSD